MSAVPEWVIEVGLDWLKWCSIVLVAGAVIRFGMAWVPSPHITIEFDAPEEQTCKQPIINS